MEGLRNSPEPNKDYFNDVKKHLEIKKTLLIYQYWVSASKCTSSVRNNDDDVLFEDVLWHCRNLQHCTWSVNRTFVPSVPSKHQHRICTMQKTSPRAVSSILGKVHSQLHRNSKYLAALMVISHCLLPPCQNDYVYSSESIKLLSSKAKNMCWKAKVH